jgi:hypothetical protein
MSSGDVFVVDKVEGWAYLAAGIFATGHFGQSFESHPSNGAPPPSEEKDILIPYDKINYIEFDFAAYERYMDSPEPPRKRELED